MSEPATRTVLLVEDDPGHAELICRGLRAGEVDVAIEHARDGVEALELLRLRGSEGRALTRPPALVLLDLRLPRLNGFEVLRAIKSSRLARVPVVVLSTSDNARDVQEAYSLRANSYLVKPVDFTRLSVMLRSVRAYWLELNRVCDELE